MAVGVRTQDLRKVYNSAPPAGAGGGFIARGDAKGSKQPKAQIPALDGLSLEILPGEIFGLLGPNGAGKSTTVGVLTTRVRPTSGQAWIGDHDVWKQQAEVKRLIGVVPQRPNLDFSLTAREILVFHGAYFGIGSKQRNERADALARKVQADRARQPDGARLFRRHDAAALHCPRHDARSASSVSRRAQRRARSANSDSVVGDHSRIPPGRKDSPADHAQHGGGRRAVPAPRHH